MAPSILIIGAGPAGTVCALALAKKGIASILIDKARFPRDKICGDALSGAGVNIIKKLDSKWICELNSFGMGVDGLNIFAPSGKNGRIHFFNKNINEGYSSAYVAKRFVFDNWLVTKVREEPLIKLIEGEEIRTYTRTDLGWVAKTKSGAAFTADIIVACDGANSQFVKEVEGYSTDKVHNCFGIRTYYKNIDFIDSGNYMEMHFMSDILPGYLCIFRLPNNEFNVGMSLRADIMGKKKINLKKKFEEIISSHPTISERFKNAERIDDLSVWGLPLGSKNRKNYGDHYLLCGDAAMQINPMTGKGVGNAMTSGYYAAEAISKAMVQNDFSARELVNYQKSIQRVMGPELKMSSIVQNLAKYTWLVNFVVHRIVNNHKVNSYFSTLLEDSKHWELKNPKFYWKLFLRK
jgi:geranylgeranyl reductase family protein